MEVDKAFVLTLRVQTMMLRLLHDFIASVETVELMYKHLGMEQKNEFAHDLVKYREEVRRINRCNEDEHNYLKEIDFRMNDVYGETIAEIKASEAERIAQEKTQESELFWDFFTEDVDKTDVIEVKINEVQAHC